MIDREHATEMLRAARRDLRSLVGMLRAADDFDDEIFGFHAQQTVEKALKAWIASKGVRFPLIHSLKALIDVLEAEGEDVRWLPDLTFLSRFAVQLRYTSLDPGVTLDRAALFEKVHGIYRHVEMLLKA